MVASDVHPASEKQRAFLAELLKRKNVAPAVSATIQTGLAAGVSKRQASIWIDGLLRLADRPVDPLPSVPSIDQAAPADRRPPASARGDHWPSVAEGRYAVVDPTDGVLKFYAVDKPKEGRWEGYTFLAVFASSERHSIKGWETKKRIMDAIAADPKGALQRYGQELGVCGVCGRALTDALSRRFGIGPVCRGKLGYEVEPASAEMLAGDGAPEDGLSLGANREGSLDEAV